MEGGSMLKFVSVELDTHRMQGKNRTLNKISGFVQTGEILAIMGPSGAGKTALLDYLSGRLQGRLYEEVGGLITWKEKKINSHQRRDMFGYVPCNSPLLPSLTIYQHILHSIMIRLAGRFSSKEILEKCDELIEALGLEGVKPNLIATASHGEKKRVSLAIQMADTSEIMLLDEPTSGLSSADSLSLLKLLKKIAVEKKIGFIISIHQPRSGIYEYFDQVLLLSQGHLAFFGTNQEALTFFAKAGYPCPSFYNPAEHLLKIIYNEGPKMVELFSKTNIEDTISNINDEHSHEEKTKNWNILGSFLQIGLLLRRDFIFLIKSPTTYSSYFAALMVTTIVCGFLFFQISLDDSHVSDILSLSFIWCSSFPYISTTLFEQASARVTYFKGEVYNKVYSPMVYSIFLFLTTLWRCVLFHLVISLILFFMFGLPAQDFPFLFAVLILHVLFWEYLGLILLHFLSLAVTLSLVFHSIGLTMLFAGFYFRPITMPSWIRWVVHITPIRFGFEAVVARIFGNRMFGSLSGEDLKVQYDVEPNEFVSILRLFYFFIAMVGLLVVYTHVFPYLHGVGFVRFIQKFFFFWKKENFFISVEEVVSEKPVLSPKNFSFSWNLSFSVSDKHGERKDLLNQVSGKIESGEMVAIIGPSGAGKTTLLECLAGWKVTKYDGEILFSGMETNPNFFPQNIGYVAQDEPVISELTVDQFMTSSALLSLSKAMTYEEKMNEKTRILKILGLSSIIKNKINKISDGQKKRLLLARELLGNKPIVLLDEPTTGLSSEDALNTINIFKDLAEYHKKAVLMSIHQPSSEILLKFDKLIFLHHGRVVYSGPTNSIQDYFKQLGHECPEFYNPADFVLDLVGASQGDTLSESWFTSPLSKDQIQKIVSSERKEWIHDYQSSDLTQFTTLLKRFCLTFLQSLSQLTNNLELLVLASFLVILASNLTFSVDEIREWRAAISFHLSSLVSGAAAILPVALESHKVFCSEYKKGLYKSHIYFLAKELRYALEAFILSFLATTIIFWAIGFPSDAFPLFFISTFIVLWVWMELNLMVISFSSNYGVLVSALSLVYFLNAWYSGFFRTKDHIPKWGYPFYYVNCIRMGLEILTESALKTVTFEGTTSPFKPSISGRLVVDSFNVSPWFINLILLLVIVVITFTTNFVLFQLMVKKTLQPKSQKNE